MYRLGVVSFLNARPLIAGLADRPDVRLIYDVPARLPRGLDSGRFDAALVPIVDVLRRPEGYRIVSDACIGCDGETMTVRVFAQVPPHRITTLHADSDSHTSVLLARLLWREVFGVEIEIRPLDAQVEALEHLPAVLLIGDKVVDPRRTGFAYKVDLGGAWKQLTGLPFVFAVWARRADKAADIADQRPNRVALATLLSQARDRGVRRAGQIAETDGPVAGWPVELARRYLTRCLRYRLDARAVEGVETFVRLCASAGWLQAASIHWPEDLPREVVR